MRPERVYREALAVERAQSAALRSRRANWRAHLEVLEWSLGYWLERLS